MQEIGAYAGLASVAGLAILSALYFSQARDVKRLREWAGRAPERAVTQAPAPGSAAASPASGGAAASPAHGDSAAAPVPGAVASNVHGETPAAPAPGEAAAPPVTGGPTAAPVPGRAAAMGARPAAATAAGQGAPAAATPAGAGAAAQGKPAAAPRTGARESSAVPTGEEVAQGDAAVPTDGGTEVRDQEVTPEGAGAPARAGSGASAGAEASPRGNSLGPSAPVRFGAPQTGQASSGGPATPAGGRSPGAPPVPRPPRFPSRSGVPPGAAPQETAIIAPPRKRPWYRQPVGSPRYVALTVAGVLIIGGAAAFGISRLGGGGGAAPAGEEQVGSTGSGERAGDGGRRRGGAPVRPGSVTVAVLNGTTVPGLAAQLGDQISSFGFQVGTIANGSDPNQQLAESVVQYSSGHEREAAAVGRRLGIPQREPVTEANQGLAGDATVVVIAGADKSE